MNVAKAQGQTLLDISIAHTGSLESLFAIAVQNERSVTGDVDIDSVQVTAENVNKKNVDFYRKNKVIPATQERIRPEGIGVWVIGNDFIVK